MGLSADLVTIIFFISGLIGSVFYLFDSIIFSLIGYFFFRLHIIIDMSDGDVARFNKSFSIRGSYWDSMIHSILNPLYHLSISFSYYLVFDNIIFLIIAPFLVLSSSLLMAVKNNYFKALLFNNKTENKKSSKKMSRLKYIFYYTVSEILSIEGFVFIAILIKYLNIYELALAHLIFFFSANLLISCIKFYNYSYSGYTFRKS